MHTRRTFLLNASLAAGATLIPRHAFPSGQQSSAAANAQSRGANAAASNPQTPTARAINASTLPQFVDPLPILAVARPVSTGRHPVTGAAIPLYRMPMREVYAKIHRDLPPTRQWIYGNGEIINVRANQPILVEWPNNLPTKHFLPIDHTLHGAERDKPEVRGVVHLHGGKTAPDSDGWPESWYAPGGTSTCFYPNQQDACALWFHDHAMGINRLNIYAGLYGLYLIRDSVEDALALPSGNREIPITIADRLLHADGQLLYPVSSDPAAPWVPEVFGDAILVNNKLAPYLEVAPALYRFRILNASNGRFYRLALDNGAEFFQIGSDQGLLAAPVLLKHVQIAPGERVDLLIDFSTMSGSHVILRDDQFRIMQFRVAPAPISSAPNSAASTSSAPSPANSAASANSQVALPPHSHPATPLAQTSTALAATSIPATLRPVPRTPESSATTTRRLFTYETMKDSGESKIMLLNDQHWDMPITEKPVLGTTEIWEFVNMTDDSHPIHLHLVKFQVLDRRRFEPSNWSLHSVIRFTGAAVPPAPNELGWKDTVRADPHMVTRIIVRFDGWPGKYVWHCHILEHEDNEMMRPYEVLPA